MNGLSMRNILAAVLLAAGCCHVCAQTTTGDETKGAEIKFNEVSHDFGQFPESSPKVEYTFSYTNTGDKPLVINQAVASCGCTVAEYTKKPVQPGGKGEVKVTYNGEGRALGHFKKIITVRTNGIVEIVRLAIEGEMTAD